jgi:hypothetical protein
MMLVIEAESDIVSSAFRLYAADPPPRSAVCRNHDGSFDCSDWAISLLEGSDSLAESDPGVASGGLISLSEMTEVGRLCTPLEVLDCGRCCQDRVPARAGAAPAFDEDCDGSEDLVGEGGRSRSAMSEDCESWLLNEV